MIKQLYHPDYEKPDAERRSCSDCHHMQAAVSWWCTNDKAIEYRGTPFPGVHNCIFWAPIKPAPRRMIWFGESLFGPLIQEIGERQKDGPVYTLWMKILDFFGICPHRRGRSMR